MTQTSITVSFAPGAGSSGFRLEYLADDNILPSKVEGALDTLAAQLQAEGQATIRRYPTLWGSYGSNVIRDAVQAALRDPKVRAGEQLYNQDVAAWSTRRLRLYPASNARLTCSYGTVLPRHSVTTVVSETLVFTGSDNAALNYVGQGAAMTAVGRAYDTSGNLIGSLQLTYVDGKVVAPQPIYAIVDVSYSATYRVVELSVTATGGEFQVLVAAFLAGEHTSVMVPFEPVEFDPAEETLRVGGGVGFGTSWPVLRGTIDDAAAGVEDEGGSTSHWQETSRSMSTVDVDGVTVKRIEEVTFSRGLGASPVTLKFDNSGVM